MDVNTIANIVQISGEGFVVLGMSVKT